MAQVSSQFIEQLPRWAESRKIRRLKQVILHLNVMYETLSNKEIVMPPLRGEFGSILFNDLKKLVAAGRRLEKYRLDFTRTSKVIEDIEKVSKRTEIKNNIQLIQQNSWLLPTNIRDYNNLQNSLEVMPGMINKIGSIISGVEMYTTLENNANDMLRIKLKAAGSIQALLHDCPDDICIVCKDVDLARSTDIAALDCCRHIFCRPCIEEWTTKVKSCPGCRRPFEVLLPRSALEIYFGTGLHLRDH